MLFRVEGHHCNLLIQIVKQKYELECEVVVRVNWCPGLGWNWSNFLQLKPGQLDAWKDVWCHSVGSAQSWVCECCRARLCLSEGEALAGGCLCCWRWRAGPRGGVGLGAIPCALGAAALLWDTQKQGAVIPSVCWWAWNELCCESPVGRKTQRYFREAFPVPSTCTPVKSKSKIQKRRQRKEKILFHVTLLASYNSSFLLVFNKKSRLHAFKKMLLFIY